MWKNSSHKIKHETLCNDYKGGGLQNIDISIKIISFQCLLIRRLYNNLFHKWKLLQLFLIKKSLAVFLNFIFKFQQEKNQVSSIFLHWKKHLTRKPEIPSCILSWYLRYNEHIQVDKNSIYLVQFFEKNINYVSPLFRPDG